MKPSIYGKAGEKMERDLRGCKHQPVSVCDVCKAERIRDAAPEMLALLRQAAALGVGNADNYTWQDWFNSNSALLSRLDGQE